MKQLWLIVINCVIFGRVSEGHGVNLSFPANFKVGVATSSYQVEGAWNVGGKGINIWDVWTHNHSEQIVDGENGDVACNSYYKYKEDVQLIKSIGLDFLRFSISWSRILPTGFSNNINKEGLQYYKNLTAELLANGIDPIVTMYHWDHPQVVEDMGGWTNELMVDWFVSYARILFEELGDSVKIWVTINEPGTFCLNGYEEGEIKIAPGKVLQNIGGYICGHNVLKAHAKTYRMYDEEFRATQQGQVGFVNNCVAYLPKNSGDIKSAETAFQFNCGWFFHPIYKGDYPKIMKERIAMISEAQGYEKSRLPEFTEEWISYIKGTADYLGLNHYTSMLVFPDPGGEIGIYNADNGLIQVANSSWHQSPTSTWLYVYPPGLGYLLRKLRDEYDNPPVRIMENGYSDKGGLKDYDRISYHHGYLKELLTAVNQDGCKVESYAVWSIIDNFEWFDGYTAKFGITRVDFSDPARNRTAKLSAFWWTDVLKTRELQAVL